MAGAIIVVVEQSKEHIKENLDVKTELNDLIKKIRPDLSTIYTSALQKLGSSDTLTKELQEYLRLVISGELFENSYELKAQMEKQYLPKVEELISRLENL